MIHEFAGLHSRHGVIVPLVSLCESERGPGGGQRGDGSRILRAVDRPRRRRRGPLPSHLGSRDRGSDRLASQGVRHDASADESVAPTPKSASLGWRTTEQSYETRIAEKGRSTLDIDHGCGSRRTGRLNKSRPRSPRRRPSYPGRGRPAWRSICLRNRTEPSTIAKFAPPGCRLPKALTRGYS